MCLPKNSHLAHVFLRPNDVNVSSPPLSWLVILFRCCPQKKSLSRKVGILSQFEGKQFIFLFVRLPLTSLHIPKKKKKKNKMKRSFFQAAVTSILLYGCTTWTLTKRLEKKLDGNYTRMLRAILNKSWQQHPTRHQLYGHLPPSRNLFKLGEPDMQDIAGEAEMNS